MQHAFHPCSAQRQMQALRRDVCSTRQLRCEMRNHGIIVNHALFPSKHHDIRAIPPRHKALPFQNPAASQICSSVIIQIMERNHSPFYHERCSGKRDRSPRGSFLNSFGSCGRAMTVSDYLRARNFLKSSTAW